MALDYEGVRYIKLLQDDGVVEVKKDTDGDTVVSFDGKPLEQIFCEQTGLGVGTRQKAYLLLCWQLKPGVSEDVVPA